MVLPLPQTTRIQPHSFRVVHWQDAQRAQVLRAGMSLLRVLRVQAAPGAEEQVPDPPDVWSLCQDTLQGAEGQGPGQAGGQGPQLGDGQEGE